MNRSRRRSLAGLVALAMAAAARSLRAADGETIRLNIPGPHLMPFFPLELIPALGIDRELGVRLVIRYQPSGVLAAEDMLSGNADFAGCGFPILPNFVARGKNIAAIATLSSGAPPYGIIVRKELAGKIRSIRDLRGRSLGVQIGSASTKTYLQLLAEVWVGSQGIQPREVRWTPIAQNYEGARGALAGAIVDAVFCEEPAMGTLAREGLGVRIASLADPGTSFNIAGRNHIRSVLTVAPQTLVARPAAARTMVRMLRRSLKWIHETPLEQLPRRLGIADPAQRADIVLALDRLPNFFSRDGGFNPSDIDATREFMKSVGISMPDGRDIAALIDRRWLE